MEQQQDAFRSVRRITARNAARFADQPGKWVANRLRAQWVLFYLTAEGEEGHVETVNAPQSVRFMTLDAVAAWLDAHADAGRFEVWKG